MRTTPAQRTLQRKLAAQASAAAPHGGELEGTAYELMLAQLADHRRKLKDIQSVERKIQAKREFLPEYDAWVDGALSAGAGAADLVLTTVMVWHIDAGNYARALQIAVYALAHDLPMPDQYERDLPTVLIDEFGVAAITGAMSRGDALELLPRVLEATQGRDAPDQARAKLYKALGYALIGKSIAADVDYESAPPAPEACRTAAAHLARALLLDERVGVKKDIERLERHLKKVAPPGA
ncbi:phage terminase small subunit [uncultured Xylophilus sp.]|uniref:phage terminase small subunit n=1 Tax=uncultured Xylophilus sp. TaxID=296832 RepID=UPI0025E8110B|nr:phage terminase small subunit [uncultured Xylophilus sp.]